MESAPRTLRSAVAGIRCRDLLQIKKNECGEQLFSKKKCLYVVTTGIPPGASSGKSPRVPTGIPSIFFYVIPPELPSGFLQEILSGVSPEAIGNS